MVLTFSHTKTAELMEGYRPSSVFHQLRYAILERMKSGEDVIPLIQGRAEAKEDVIRAILSRAHPYIISEEGTGKTRLVRSIVDLLPPVRASRAVPTMTTRPGADGSAARAAVPWPTR
jgi:Mg-chelatase subunit ChlI